jgi:hypothetical protein
MTKRSARHRHRLFQPQDYVILGLGTAVGAAFVIGTWMWIHAF